MNETFSHLDDSGEARMVNIGAKPTTKRRAVAEGFVRCSDTLQQRIRADDLAKGSVLRIAQIAGIQAAKRTDELIPLCHTIPLDHIDVQLELAPGGIRIRAEASATWTTGVEMEAFTAVMAAALTVIDMAKAIDKSMVVEGVRLVEKNGGRSGTYQAHDAAGAVLQPREKSP